jgi:hypothetical protein
MRRPVRGDGTALLPVRSPNAVRSGAMRFRRSRGRRGGTDLAARVRRPEPTSEPAETPVGALAPGVRRRLEFRPRPRDWNTRLRDSLTGGSGGAPFWRP